MSTPDSTSTTSGDEGSERRYDVTIVIPAYNEENAIEAEIEHINQVMKASKYSYQLIIVDDHSADKTHEIASKCDCKVIRQPRNMGYGAALKRGFKAARSDLVIITDADGTYPAEAMPGMLDLPVLAPLGRTPHPLRYFGLHEFHSTPAFDACLRPAHL
jgi:glycosyltransferase involved in cell wall biosynthesis